MCQSETCMCLFSQFDDVFLETVCVFAGFITAAANWFEVFCFPGGGLYLHIIICEEQFQTW